jgi:hypothetical protein
MWRPEFRPGCNAPGKIGIGHFARVEIYEVGPCGNDLAVSLQSDGGRVTPVARKSRRDDTAVPKGSIKRSIPIIADYFEIAGKGKERKGSARDYDFAVRLNDY